VLQPSLLRTGTALSALIGCSLMHRHPRRANRAGV
jgi:hypothetical protein